MTSMIATEALTKTYGGARGIDDVTLTVNEGEIFGFLGPNGAGKTTTIRTLMGLLRPTSGRATIAGLDCWEQATAIKRFLGYLPSEFSFDPAPHRRADPHLPRQSARRRGPGPPATTWSIAWNWTSASVSASIRAAISRRSGSSRPSCTARACSSSTSRPAASTRSTSRPSTTSSTRRTAAGATVFVSSHILPEVEHLCQRVGIIREGKLITVDEVAALKDLKQRVVEVTFPSPPRPTGSPPSRACARRRRPPTATSCA